jgi:trigger factor
LKVELTNKETNVVQLKVEVPQETVEQTLEKAYLKTRKDFSLPGFRKGRVPRNILEKRYGVEVFYEEAANILLQETYPRAIEEHNLDPIEHPDVDVEQIDRDQPFVYIATVTVMPILELGQYKDLGIAKEDKQIGDEDTDRELEDLRNRKSKMISLEGDDVTAAEQDQVIIDFVGRLDGEEFGGGAGTNHPLILGSGSFVPGFEDQLIGSKLGDKIIVKVSMPDEYHSEQLAGKDVEFEVDVKEIKRKEVPALDDDFAKEMGDYATLAELKDFIRERLQDRADNQAIQEQREKVVNAVRDNSIVDIPAIMIDNEVEVMVKQMAGRIEQQGLKLVDYLSYTGKQLDDIKGEMRPDAEKSVKTEIMLDTVAKVENIIVEPADLDEEVALLAQTYGQEADKIRKALEANGQMSGIQQVILHRKVIDFLTEANNVK